MKKEIVATIVGGIVALSIVGFTCLTDDKQELKNFVESVDDEQVLHDWECKFCIEDGYNGNGNTLYHYINEYKRNTNHSISFVGHDGLLWVIPYPYFYIHVNEHYKGSEHNVNPKAK